MADPAQRIHDHAGSPCGGIFCRQYDKEQRGSQRNGKCTESGILFSGRDLCTAGTADRRHPKDRSVFPTYWYAQNISILSFNDTLTDSLRSDLYQGMLIQILFAVACVAVALAIGKARRQEEA